MTSKARGLANLGNAYDDGALSNRNLIINGAMQVAQRGTSLTNTAINGPNVLDRFSLYLGGDPNKVTFDLSQSTDAPEGFIYSYKVAVNSLGSGTTPITCAYSIEGSDSTQLSWGKSNAKPATLSFWVKGNITGSYAIEFKAYNGSNHYRNVMNYTIDTAGVWEYKTLTVAPLTSFLPAYGNTTGVSFEFWLDDNGGAYNSDNTAFGTWIDSAVLTNGSRAYGQTAQICDSTSNYWQITGVQLEVGDTATPFEHRSYSDQLQSCQRYFWKGTIYSGFRFAQNTPVGPKQWPVYFSLPVEMRVFPTAAAQYTNLDASRDGGLQHLTTTNGMLAMTSSYSGEYASAYWVVSADAEL